MAQPTFLNIIRRTVDTWVFVTDIYPEPDGASGYNGIINGDNTISFTDKNGATRYNHISYTIIEYIDEYGSNSLTPTSAEELIIHLKSEGFFGNGSGDGGATTFEELSDVTIFGGYPANQGRVPMVDGSGLIMVTPSFAFQNNIGKWYYQTLEGTGEVVPSEVSELINDGAQFIFAVTETSTPVFVSIQRTELGVTRRFMFNFIAGKPSSGTLWGAGGVPTTASQFRLLSILTVTPSDLTNDPNTIIKPIGTVPIGENFWEVANDLPDPQTPFDLTDSGEIQPDGNPLVYYFSFTQNSVLYYAQFVGSQGLYGGTETPFVEADFIVTTNDTIGDTPNLQTVTNEGNTTTNPIVIYSAVDGNKISFEDSQLVYTDANGNTLTLRFPVDAATGDVVIDIPAKDADDTFAMVSDISGGITDTDMYRFDGYETFLDEFSDEEGQFVRINSTKILYIYRHGTEYGEVSTTGAVYQKVSNDNGETWGNGVLIYNSTDYDDRNIVTGITPNGNIVVAFRRYDPLTLLAHDSGWVYSTNEGSTWSSYNVLVTTTGANDNHTPFGQLITRGTTIGFMTYVSVTGGTHIGVLWESIDDGLSFPTNTALYDFTSSPSPSLGEPYLIDLPNGKSLIYLRSRQSNALGVSVYQLESDDGYVFSGKIETNINEGALNRNNSTGFAYLDGDNIIVMFCRRYRSPETYKNTIGSLQIYIQPYADVDNNALAYVKKHEILRPVPNNVSFAGYPWGIRLDNTTWLFSVMDRQDVEIGVQKYTQNLFRFSKLAGNDFLTLPSKYNGTYVVKNEYNGGFDYVSTYPVPTIYQKIDTVPTEGSANVVTSGGIYSAIEDADFVQSVSGALVDNTDPKNPVINSPTIDAVPTDGSPNAVSSNGVFDAITAKTLFADTVDSSTVTGTTSETILKDYFIPANTIGVGTLSLESMFQKTGTAGACTYNVRINTTASLSGATLIASTGSVTATDLTKIISRKAYLKTGNSLVIYPAGSGISLPAQSSLAPTSITFDPTVDNYIIISVTLANAADSAKSVGTEIRFNYTN
jgi:hypothetical protein